MGRRGRITARLASSTQQARRVGGSASHQENPEVGAPRACLGRRSGQVVYVRGEAGIGKTRLVERCVVSPRPRASLLIAVLYSTSGLAKDRTRSAPCS